MTRTIHAVLGARPNQMKETPLLRALREHSEFTPFLANTGAIAIVSHSFGMLKNVCECIGLPENRCVKDIDEPEQIIEVCHGRVEPSLNSSSEEKG